MIKVNDRVMIPQEEYPEINFVGLLIGPRGNTLKGELPFPGLDDDRCRNSGICALKVLSSVAAKVTKIFSAYRLFT